VAAETLSGFDPDALPFVTAVSNPLPAAGGLDAEMAAEVRQLAPEAFKGETYRAVQADDYAEAAERLPWVERAGARFRFTGSWLTAFVTPDPAGSVTVSDDQRRELSDQLDRFRQAGREAHATDPLYADLDVEITACAETSSYANEVSRLVLDRLLGSRADGRDGFFSADHFTFGTPLYRSRLEAAVQAVPGVKAVRGIRIRRRGHFDWRPLTGPYLPVRDQEVIRVENDREHPDRGSLILLMEGGA
jgi:predicted phage baseplate assembly protein